jgi:hypothetical protein
VTVQITNDGEATHDFAIDDLDLSTGPMEPGTVMTAEFTVPDGTGTYRCTIHSGMGGEIRVSRRSSAWPSANRLAARPRRDLGQRLHRRVEGRLVRDSPQELNRLVRHS